MYVDNDKSESGRNVIILANCHGWMIRLALKGYSADFMANSNVHFASNYEGNNLEFVKRAESCDFLIYQTEKSDETKVRFEQLRAALSSSATIIRFPMIGFTPFWPTTFRDYGSLLFSDTGTPMFAQGDRLVVNLYKKGLSASEIIDSFLNSEIATSQQLDRMMEAWMLGMQAQEKECDITISDFIIDHVLRKKTFYWPAHCANFVLFEVVERILKLLGKMPLDPAAASAADGLHDWELPIHPAVISHLGVKYLDSDSLYLTPDKKQVSISEYLERYIAYLPERYPELRAK